MKKITISTIGAAALLTAACGSQTSSTTTTGSVRAASVAAASVRTGTATNIRTSGTIVSVTLLTVADPATARPALTPPAGAHLVGLEFQFTNLGPAGWSDTSMLGMAAYDPAGSRLPLVLNHDATADPYRYGGVAGLHQPAVGLTNRGWVLAEVPSGDSVAQVDYTAPGAATVVFVP